jgi:hypothetical protein
VLRVLLEVGIAVAVAVGRQIVAVVEVDHWGSRRSAAETAFDLVHQTEEEVVGRSVVADVGKPVVMVAEVGREVDHC